MSTENNQPQQVAPPQGIQFVQVDTRFLQAIVDYMRKRPYEEVHMFLDVLLNKGVPQPPPQEYPTENNISEFVPEGFSTDTPTAK
jgi:hypothetical protein